MLKRWNDIFRWTITAIGFGIFVGSVFFTFTGDVEFLKTFEYWGVTIGSTAFAWALRWLWQPKGEDVELKENVEINEKQNSKESLISTISQNNLTPELRVKCDKRDSESKLDAWFNHCDEKRKKYKYAKFFPFRKYLYNKWQNRFDLVKEYKTFSNKEEYDGEFNLENIKIDYVTYNIDDILSYTYKPNGEKRRTRYSRSNKLRSSYRINIITFVSMGIFQAIQIILTDFSIEDLVTLGGQLIMFFLNIRSGFNLGVLGIKDDYNADLVDDIAFLRAFLKENGIKEIK